jgi:Fe2+ transport system protein FeoA
MKIIGNNKGQILVYFLIIATFIAITWAGIMRFHMDAINRSIRTTYISELKAECDYNMAACRIAKENNNIFVGAENELPLKTRALKNLIRVLNKVFQFSPDGRIGWVNLQKRLESLGVLKGENVYVQIDVRYADEMLQVYRDMQLFLVKVQGHDNNFDF